LDTSAPSETERAIARLLRETERAHAVYEREVLGGVRDEAWPAWYAAYLLDLGLGRHTPQGDSLAADPLAAALTRLDDAYRREQPAHEWPEYYARGLSEGVG
jgi:hypothetical protein